MKKAKLQIEGLEVIFDISSLELKRKGTIFKSKLRSCREFTLFNQPIGIRISLESSNYTPLEFQLNSKTLLDYQAQKYLENDITAETENIKSIVCESNYCYLPIESWDKSGRLILFAKILGNGKYFILNVNGYDYADGSKKSPFEKLHELGKVMMEKVTINKIC